MNQLLEKAALLQGGPEPLLNSSAMPLQKERQRAYETDRPKLSLLTQTMENKPDSSSAGQEGDGAETQPKDLPTAQQALKRTSQRCFDISY
ncbi:hypothetical protein RRG08_039934 [Elysia crispata]|uniref:Uncharacterized protein n=1 Tax=Elysia crispata TaxID=231223 RepID=A0AAE1BCM3_9GAST|nr:hypothetical protein RRG08_039934 [Elysia crispata]